MKRKFTVKASVEMSHYCDLPDVQFTKYPTMYSDGFVCYHGYEYDVRDFEDPMWDDYNEYCEEEGIEPTDDGFDQYISDNTDQIYEYLDNLEEAHAGTPYSPPVDLWQQIQNVNKKEEEMRRRGWIK